MSGRGAWLVAAGVVLALGPADGPAGGEAVKPVHLEKVNTEADEADPFPLPGGTDLLYASNAGGTFALYLSRRGPGVATWPAGKRYLGDKKSDTRSPFVYKGTLYYATNEVPDEKFAGLKNFDLFSRVGERAPLPVAGVSEKTDELHPWVTPAGKEFYFSRKTEDGWQLLVARGPVPGPIGDARPVGLPAGFCHATLSAGALVMYVQGPLEGGRTGLFRSKRAKVGAAWSAPEPLTALNHPGGKTGDLSPALTSDGVRLYFASDRPGGKGGLDLWSVPTAALK